MNEVDIYLEGWRYDLWANKIWLEAVRTMPSPARPLEVMEHMAAAQAIWMPRVRPDLPKPEGALEERFEKLNQYWVSIVKKDDLRRIVDYHTLTGQPYRTELGAIVRHVIDHGTYHRGQLRGLAEMQGWNDFPETSYIGLFRTFGMHQ